MPLSIALRMMASISPAGVLNGAHAQTRHAEPSVSVRKLPVFHKRRSFCIWDCVYSITPCRLWQGKGNGTRSGKPRQILPRIRCQTTTLAEQPAARTMSTKIRCRTPAPAAEGFLRLRRIKSVLVCFRRNKMALQCRKIRRYFRKHIIKSILSDTCLRRMGSEGRRNHGFGGKDYGKQRQK